MKYETEKILFTRQLKEFAGTLENFIAKNDAWAVRGFIDSANNIICIF